MSRNPTRSASALRVRSWTVCKIVICTLPAVLFTACEAGKQGDACDDSVLAAATEEDSRACSEQFLHTGNVDDLRVALSAAARLGDSTAIEELVDAASKHPDLGDALYMAASATWESGQKPVADRLYELSADAFQRRKNLTGLSKALHGRQFIAWQASRHREALQLAHESLQAATKSGSRDQEVAALNALFNLFEEIGSLGAAAQAMSLIEERLGAEVSGNRINAYISRGLLEMNQRNFGLAAHQFDQALQAAEGSDNRSALRGLHLNIVGANLELGRLDVAKEHMEIAWGYAEPDGSGRYGLLYFQGRLDMKTGNPETALTHFEQASAIPDLPQVWLWELHYNAGLAAQQMNDHRAAAVSFGRSIDALETMREQLAYNDLKSQLLAVKRQPFEAMLQSLVATGDLRAAVDVMERAKARAFIDAFIDSGTPEVATTDAISVAAVADRLEAIRMYVSTLRSSDAATLRPVSKLAEELKDANILSHFVAGDSLWIASISDGDLRMSASPASATEIDRLHSAYNDNPDNEAVLAELGAALFPTAHLPPPGVHLFVVPDDRLASIGLASLRVDSIYLSERNTVSIVPSVNALSVLVRHETGPSENDAVRIFADPLGDLPAARNEASRVATHIGGEVYAGDKAAFSAMLNDDSVAALHFATHSGMDNVGPWLQFADGRVSAEAILRMKLRSQVTFLASCVSGAANQQSLWGSLGGVFLSNGSSAVVVASRSVSDAATAELVDSFYAHLAGGASVSDALALAQREAHDAGLPPSAWGAFAVLGDGRVRIRN